MKGGSPGINTGRMFSFWSNVIEVKWMNLERKLAMLLLNESNGLLSGKLFFFFLITNENRTVKSSMTIFINHHGTKFVCVQCKPFFFSPSSLLNLFHKNPYFSFNPFQFYTFTKLKNECWWSWSVFKQSDYRIEVERTGVVKINQILPFKATNWTKVTNLSTKTLCRVNKVNRAYTR